MTTSMSKISGTDDNNSPYRWHIFYLYEIHLNMKKFKVFLLNSLIMVASSFVLQIIRLVFNIYVSNKISREALGIFQLIMTTYMFGITLAASRN